MTQIEKIEFLISEYSKGNYTTKIFCDEFVTVLYYEKDESISSELYNKLDEYASIFSRFSPYDEDVESGILFSEEKIQNTFQKLIAYWETLSHN